MTITRPSKLIRDYLRKTFNKEVVEWFADVTDNDFDTVGGITRKDIRNACIIRSKDTIPTMHMKISLFRYEIQQAHLKPDIYGIPTLDFHESVVYLPQVVIHWKERSDIANANNRAPIKAQCSIRYKGAYESRADLVALKTKIKGIFTTGQSLHHWTKGKNKYSYRDKIKGYEMIVTAGTVDDAKDVISKMLAIQNDVINNDYLTTSTTDRSFAARETIQVAGRIFEKPKRRPAGEVYFSRAEFKIHGMPKDLVLVSVDGKSPDESL